MQKSVYGGKLYAKVTDWVTNCLVGGGGVETLPW